jgi:hypothetical protein
MLDCIKARVYGRFVKGRPFTSLREKDSPPLEPSRVQVQRVSRGVPAKHSCVGKSDRSVAHASVLEDQRWVLLLALSEFPPVRAIRALGPALIACARASDATHNHPVRREQDFPISSGDDSP